MFKTNPTIKGKDLAGFEITVNRSETNDTTGITCTTKSPSSDLNYCLSGTKACYTIDDTNNILRILIITCIAYL